MKLTRIGVIFGLALLGVAAPAQTYLGNGSLVLNGLNTASTFEISGSTGLPALGWTGLASGGVTVWDLSTNGLIIDLPSGGFSSYGAQFVTDSFLMANSTYTLSVRMGYVSGSALPGIATYSLDLGTINGGTFTSLANTSNVASLITNFGADETNSITATATFTTGASGLSPDNIAVRWMSTNAGSPGVNADYFGFDNATLSVAAVPEPATYALWLGAGVLGVAAWRRRRSVVG
jgi:hypothetical protein